MLACAALFMIVSAPVSVAVAKEADVSWWEPATKWQVNYGENGDPDCRLLRKFGTGEEEVILELRRNITFDGYIIWALYGSGLPSQRDLIDLTIELEPQDVRQTVEAQSSRLADRTKNVLKWVDPNGDMSNGMRDDQRIRIAYAKGRDIGLHLPDMAKAIQALESCRKDLLVHWGVPEEYLKRVKVKPEPASNAGRWVVHDDYPSSDRTLKNEGVTIFLLTVSDEGKLTDCRIAESSGFASLDKRTCEMMRRRALFHPARDADDKPMAGYYVNLVRWQIP